MSAKYRDPNGSWTRPVIVALIAVVIGIPYFAMESEAQREASQPTVEVPKAVVKTDAAAEEPMTQSEQDETIATAINLAGYLCARVVHAYSIGDGNIQVVCQEYRKNARRRVKYTIDPNTMIVEPR